MKVMTTKDVRQNFAAALNAVIDDQEELVIPRDGGKAVVIIDLDTWNSLKETLHVMGDREQTRRLLNSMEHLENGLGVRHELPQLDDERGEKADAA